MTKARIHEAVREAKGEEAAERIAGLKKPEMVTAAEELLAGTGWLPEPLRTMPLAEEDTSEAGLGAGVDAEDADMATPDQDDEAVSASDEDTPVEMPDEPVDDTVADDVAVRTAAE